MDMDRRNRIIHLVEPFVPAIELAQLILELERFDLEARADLIKEIRARALESQEHDVNE